MSDITFDNLNERMVEALPELAQAYQVEVKGWREEEPPNHVMYEDLLNPFLASLLEGDSQEEVVGRVFALLEELSSHEDERVREVVGVTVLEYLVGGTLWEKAEGHMGKETLRIAKLVEAHWSDGASLGNL